MKVNEMKTQCQNSACKQSGLVTACISDRTRRSSHTVHLKLLVTFLMVVAVLTATRSHADSARPNVILVMADDQGWGETGYYNHPVLKTPNLDAMAANGLRFDRFYAGAPVCSPTRASVLTGRTNMRTGVDSHGYSLRRQEPTIAQALKKAGYATGHFGKWHLNGMRGPGVPILAQDTHRPEVFGFDEWLSVTNFFDLNPILSRRGQFEEYEGDSSEIVVDEAIKFMGRQAQAEKPFLAVIWYGTPHSPFRALPKDREPFQNLDEASRNHYGELVAMDRSIGHVRSSLRELKIADDTILWFCSDNGGLPKITPATVGGLRGFKGTIYEGGLRVPSILEWPSRIKSPRTTSFPAVTMDIFPTVADVVGLPADSMLDVTDGISLTHVIDGAEETRKSPIPFNCFGNTAIIDGDFKLLRFSKKKGNQQFELYDLSKDKSEKTNLMSSKPDIAERMRSTLLEFEESLKRSEDGLDYAEKKVLPGDPEPRFWTEVEEYKPYFESWKNRPEYESRLKPKRPKKQGK